jgi:hypothetical protein
MLQILHNLINNIVPIESISEISNNNYSINYIIEPNLNQLDIINNIISDWPLTQKKIIKTQDLDLLWEEKIQNGWQTPYGWKLGLANSDITLLIGAFIMAKEANQIGLTDPTSIVDTDGFSHELSLTDLTLLMLQYGNARAELSSKYALIKKEINNCNSVLEVSNIDIPQMFNID